MIYCGDKGLRSHPHAKRLTVRERMTNEPRSTGHVGRLKTILQTDNVAIIRSNLRLQAGIPVERIER